MPTEDAIDRVCPNCQTTVHAVGRTPVRCPQCQTLIPASSGGDDALPALTDLEHSADAPLGQQKAADDPARLAEESALPPEAVDLSGHDDVYGVVCRICDTRIHVRPQQVGQEIECPVCFSPVLVTAKVDKKKVWGRGGATYFEPAPEGSVEPDSEDSGELRLADDEEPATAPPRQTFQAESALPAAELPLEEDDLPRLQPLDEPAAPPALPPVSQAAQPKKGKGESAGSPPAANPRPAPEADADRGEQSRRQKLAAAELRRQQAEADQGFARPAASELSSEFPDFELGALASAARAMVLSSGVIVRSVVAFLIMAVGITVSELSYPTGLDPTSLKGMDWFVAALFRLLGLGIYFLGLFGLWLVCGTLFRDAASGLAKVRTWKVHGRSELLGTWLLFAFSMIIGGLPMLFLPALILPLRMLVAPLFLLSAWFNRSAWSIISVDVFHDSRKISHQWSVLYTWLTILAAVGLLSGGLLWMRAFTEIALIDVTLSVAAVALHVIITLLFAPIVGWHCGLVMAHLERK